MADMTMHKVSYSWRGEKYDGGAFDTPEEAREKSAQLAQAGFNSVAVEPVDHDHTKFCGHEGR